MLSTVHWMCMGCLLAVMIKSGNLAKIPENNYLSSSEEDERSSELPDLLLRVSKDTSSSSDDFETIQTCQSVRKQINTNDLARERGYDIKDTDKFSQIIEVDVCVNVGKPCSNISANKKTLCRQKYMKIQLKVGTKDKAGSVEDFEIPSVCECAFFYSKYNLFGSLKQI